MAQRQQGISRSTGPALAWMALAAFGALLSASGHCIAQPAAAKAPAQASGPQPPTPSDAARAWARRVVDSHDHQGQPFVVVDKHAAQVVLHRADGSVVGSAPALLGRQPGDHSLPGVGQRTQDGTLRPQDMTTPAGRFAAHAGRNHTGEWVLWMHESDALALHRLRPGQLHAVRARALAGPGPAGRRLSAGCVVVPAAFFDSVVAPLFAGRAGVVYVLPEHSPWLQLWLELPRPAA